MTERAEFRACKRRWGYSYVEGLTPKSETPHLWFGSAIHKGLETYYKGERTREELLSGWAEHTSQTDLTEAQLELLPLGPQMLEAYYGYAQKFDSWVVKEVEKRFQVKIRNPHTGELVEDVFVGKMDMVVEEGGKIFLVDHKTSKLELNYSGLEVDDQVTAYCYLYWRDTGIVPAGVHYNVLLKGVYSEPQLLKNGTLSKSKSQGTNYHTYAQTIQKLGLNVNDYSDILDYLKQFQPVQRYHTLRSVKELQNFEVNLWEEYQDMQKARQGESRRYPNPGASSCSYCQFLSLCIVQNRGGDTDWLKQNMYTKYVRREDIKQDGI